MTRLIKLVAVAAVALAAPAFAGQISNSYRSISPNQPFGGKSDGVFAGKASLYQNEMYLVNDGSRTPMGLAYYMDFTSDGDGENLQCIQNDGTAYDGTEFAVNLCTTSHGMFAAIPTSGQTIPPDMDAGSLDLAGDQTDNDGWEYQATGPLLGKRAFAVGRDGAFYTCAKMAVADVSGIDDFHIGFRKPLTAVAIDSAWDDNESFYVIGWDGTAASQTIDTEQDDDGGGTTTTAVVPATTIADATTFTACVFVSAAGVASATFNGAAVTGGAFTFDDGEPLVPFIAFVQANAAQSGEVDLYTWEAGYGTSTVLKD